MSVRDIATFACILALSGCAHVPDVAVGYYLPKSKVSFKVIRTVACNSQNFIIVSNAVTPAVAHSADTKEWHSLQLKKLRGPFSDNDAKFDLYEDGRLKGINASSTGQGEAIFKTVVTVLTPIIGFDGGSSSFPDACNFITAVGDKKPLTLTYQGEIDVANGVGQLIPADTTSGFFAAQLTDAVGAVCATVTGRETPSAPAAYTAPPAAPGEGEANLILRQPGLANISVTATRGNACSGTPIWQGQLPVAQFGAKYSLPVPSAVVFGKAVFAASFAESGALTSIQYTTTSGAGQALNAVNSLLTATQGETVAQKAADVKAEADLVAQQQRLVQCQAEPKNCK